MKKVHKFFLKEKGGHNGEKMEKNIRKGMEL